MKPEHYHEMDMGKDICTVCRNCDSHPFTPYCYKHEFNCKPWGACEDWEAAE